MATSQVVRASFPDRLLKSRQPVVSGDRSFTVVVPVFLPAYAIGHFVKLCGSASKLEASWLIFQIFVCSETKAASLSRALFLNARAWRWRKSQGGAQRAQGEQYLEFFVAAI